jgi:hypothetical protein
MLMAFSRYAVAWLKWLFSGRPVRTSDPEITQKVRAYRDREYRRRK